MSGERAVLQPRRRTAEEAARLVAEYEAGELTKRDFCRQHGLAVSTLDAYRSGRRLRLPVPSRPSPWVAVEVPPALPQERATVESGPTILLEQGRRIEVGRGFDAGK